MSGRIVAMGGAQLRPEDYDPRLNAFVLSLARRARPRVCFVGTATGDSPEYVANFYRVFSAHHDCAPADLGLFERTVADLRSFVLAQDVIWVGGGNTASLLAVWRAHGLDAVLREAWEAGVVLCGVSAGMNCWFEASTTDSFDVMQVARCTTASASCPAARARTTTARSSGGRCTGGWWARRVPAGLCGRRRGGAGVRGDALAEVVTTEEGSTAYRSTPAARKRWPPGCSDERRLGRWVERRRTMF